VDGDLAIEAQRLQNTYAHAIDIRDWDLFQSVFAPDVVADYPLRTYVGMEEWLADFVPFHDACTWTFHIMSNHLVGSDDGGVWATCYGDVRWQLAAKPGCYQHALGVYRDRLAYVDGRWVIARRQLRIVMHHADIAIPAGMTLPTSVHDVLAPDPTPKRSTRESGG